MLGPITHIWLQSADLNLKHILKKRWHCVHSHKSSYATVIKMLSAGMLCILKFGAILI